MRHQRTLLCLLMITGLAVRIILMLRSPGDLLTDSDGYLAHAKPVSEGRGFLGPYSNQPTAFRPPGYPIALAMLMRVGMTNAGSVATINLLASTVILVLTWKLACYLKLPTSWAMLSTATVSFDPLLLRYAAFPMTEVPCAAVLLAAIACFLANEHQLSQGRRSLLWIPAGLLFGVGVLVRPVILISCLFLSVAAVARQLIRRNDSGQWNISREIVLAILPGLVAAAALSPWIVRNAIHFGRLIPATTHGGYTLALGNNPDFYRDVVNTEKQSAWDGGSLDAWQRRMIALADADGVPTEDEPAMDAWYYQQATNAIREDRESFFRACFFRLRRFWATTPAGGVTSGSTSLLTGFWYSCLWLGLAFQLLHSWYRRKTPEERGFTDLWLVVESFMLMHTVYWTDTRMRAPLMPLLCILSVAGWRFAADAFVRRRKSCQSPVPQTAADPS